MQTQDRSRERIWREISFKENQKHAKAEAKSLEKAEKFSKKKRKKTDPANERGKGSKKG